MNSYYLLSLVGALYTLVFYALALVRREGSSRQFVSEGLGVTAVIVGIAYVGGFTLHPIYFLILLYLITMRVRLMVELGNQLARLGRLGDALRVYHLALQLFPDRPSQHIVQINLGATYLVCQQPEQTIAILEPLKPQIEPRAASKYLASCCYNLGMAYRRTGRRDDALRQFREVEDLYPLSHYARLAQLAREAMQQTE